LSDPVRRVRDRFGGGPVALVRRVVFKTVIGPRRYGTASGYDAERFWGDRFKKYGTGLRGSGDEGLSEGQNEAVYRQAGTILVTAAREAGVDLESASVLDVGCGPGFFTGVLHDEEVRSYTGVDITDALFPDLRARFPGYSFVRKDVASDPLDGTFDLVLMIDVAEHIVDPKAFDRALENLSGAVAAGGVLLIGPLLGRSARHLFYVRDWSAQDAVDRLPTLRPLDDVPFRNGVLMTFRKPGSDTD
jgi:SAM-dependent methyltransferase